MTETVDVRYLDIAPWESPGLVFEKTFQWLERLQIPQSILDREASRPGPKRKIPYQAVLFGAMYHHRLRQPGHMHVSAIAHDLEQLTAKQKEMLGIRGRATTKNVWSTQECLIRQLRSLSIDEEPYVDTRTGEVLADKTYPDDHVTSFDVFLNLMIAAAIPESLPSPKGLAIDGTGVEAYATQRWNGKQVHDESGPHRQKSVKKRSSPTKEKPAWTSVDLDARLGKKTATGNHPNEMYFGYEAHFGVDASPKGTVDAPRLLRAFLLVPAGSSRAFAAVSALDIVKKVAADAYQLSTIYADRGYSMLKASNWQLPLCKRGLRQVMDLAQVQRTTGASPHPGTIFIDGGLFTTAIPEKLINLPSPTAQHLDAEESQRRANLFDERSHYAYHPHGARNPENGHQRFKGPVNAGKLRCPNNSQSLRLSYENPETGCSPGTECGCAGTITLTPDEYARESQWPLFGTTAWCKLYGARNAVESFNADVRTNKLSWRRGYTKVFSPTYRFPAGRDLGVSQLPDSS